MRRERIVVAETATHSLAGRIEQLDREQDERTEAGRIDRLVLDAKKESDADAGAPSGPRQRVDRDETAQFADELQVVRKCVANGPPTFGLLGDRGGEMGRALDRHALGTSGIATSTRAYEPHTGSDHYRHAWRCWMALSADERTLLTAMYAALESRTDGGADKIARTIRAFVQHGKSAEAAAALPSFATALAPEAANAAVLLAIALGWWREDAKTIDGWPDAKAIKQGVSMARQNLRQALRRVGDLDASGVSLHSPEFVMSGGTKPLLIPAASDRELRKERADWQAVPVCMGLGAVVDGAREPCTIEAGSVDVNTAATCPVCGKWRAA